MFAVEFRARETLVCTIHYFERLHEGHELHCHCQNGKSGYDLFDQQK